LPFYHIPSCFFSRIFSLFCFAFLLLVLAHQSPRLFLSSGLYGVFKRFFSVYRRAGKSDTSTFSRAYYITQAVRLQDKIFCYFCIKNSTRYRIAR